MTTTLREMTTRKRKRKTFELLPGGLWRPSSARIRLQVIRHPFLPSGHLSCMWRKT